MKLQKNIIYKEYIFEIKSSLTYNNILVNIKQTGHLQSLGKRKVCQSNWNEYLDSLAQHKEIGYHSRAVALYIDIMH